MKLVGGEQPRPQRLGCFTVAPFLLQSGPQQRRRCTQRDAASATGLGGGEFLGRQRPFDAQHPAVEVVEPQRRQLTPARSGVGGQADHQKILFGQLSKLAGPGSPVISGDGGEHGRLSRPQQLADVVVVERPSWFDPPGTSHAPDRVHVDNPLVVGPSDGRPQDAEPGADHAEGHPVGRPAGEGGAQLDGGERHDPGVGQAPVLDQSPRRRAVPDHR